jgi:hypothetical protein
MLKKLSLAHWWQLKSCSNRFLSLQLLVLDVDGVLSDGGLWYGAEGELAKRFDVRDGLVIRFLQHVGVEVTLLNGRGDPGQLKLEQSILAFVVAWLKAAIRSLVSEKFWKEQVFSNTRSPLWGTISMILLSSKCWPACRYSRCCKASSVPSRLGLGSQRGRWCGT